MPAKSPRAMLVIDMQLGLFSSRQPRYQSNSVIANINRLLDACHVQGIPVIFIQHDGPIGDDLEPLSQGWELLPNLHRGPADHRIRKTSCDSFYRTGLQPLLHSLGVKSLIITGCPSDYCIDTTLRMAVSLDYQCFVISDAHTTSDRAHMDARTIITHHNSIWRNLICPKPVQLLTTQRMLEELGNPRKLENPRLMPVL